MKKTRRSKKKKPVPYHDVAYTTTDRALTAYEEAIGVFNQTIAGMEGRYFIKLIGNVLRLPSWFHYEPSH